VLSPRETCGLIFITWLIQHLHLMSELVLYIQHRERYLAVMTLTSVAAVCHGVSDVLESAWRIVCVPDAVTLKIKHRAPENNLPVSFACVVKNICFALTWHHACILNRECFLLMFWVKWHIFHSPVTLNKCLQYAMCHQFSISNSWTIVLAYD
jgi:hypothetical protein